MIQLGNRFDPCSTSVWMDRLPVSGATRRKASTSRAVSMHPAWAREPSAASVMSAAWSSASGKSSPGPDSSVLSSSLSRWSPDRWRPRARRNRASEELLRWPCNGLRQVIGVFGLMDCFFTAERADHALASIRETGGTGLWSRLGFRPEAEGLECRVGEQLGSLGFRDGLERLPEQIQGASLIT